MKTVYIGLGSNVGDGLKTLGLAWQRIGQHPQIELLSLSSPYGSQPVEMESENWFTNAVGSFSTSLSPEVTLRFLLEVEAEFGRRREAGAGYQDRTLDLDILQINDMISADAFLSLPHPEMAKRLFVLQPLSEIAPNLIHPVSGLTVMDLCGMLEKQVDEEGSSQELSRLSWPVTSENDVGGRQ